MGVFGTTVAVVKAAPGSAATKSGRAARDKKQVVTWAELAKHTTPDSLWVAIDGAAYDITNWLPIHPGGIRLLEFYGGRDATDPFLAYHGPGVRCRLAAFKVGDMETPDPQPLPETTVEYRRLAKVMEQSGLYKTDYVHYYKIAASLALLFCAIFWAVGHGYLVAGSLMLGLFWQQMSFCGHDALHHSITSHETGCRKIDNYLGLLTGCFLGIGFSFWTDNHNAHHGVVNSSNCDPECQFLPFLAPTSIHIKDTPEPTKAEQLYLRICKYLVSYQHLSLLPLLLVARYKFYIQALGHIAMGKIYYHRWIELAAELTFFSWYGLLVSLVPGWQNKVIFVLMSHAADCFLYLQTVITHFPRDMHTDLSQEDWMVEQCLGTLNWSCPPYMDWLHGGLHFQIEHHLFPRLPRHNLRKASEIIAPLCISLGIDYHSPTFFGAVYETLVGLEKVAMIARKG